MRTNTRLFILSLLVSSHLAASVCVAAEAQEHDHSADAASSSSEAQGPSAVKGGLWSDPSTWSGGAVPKAGDIVTIEQGMELTLDVSPPALNGVNLNGKLSFADGKDVELTTEWILLRGGELHIGSEGRPHKSNATITLTNKVPEENVFGMGDRGIMLVGGVL